MVYNQEIYIIFKVDCFLLDFLFLDVLGIKNYGSQPLKELKLRIGNKLRVDSGLVKND